LEELQADHLELRRFEHCSAGQVHQWSDMPAAEPLYESVIVYENYPAGVATPAASGADGHDASYHYTGARTAYPLTFLISTRAELVINAIADGSRLDQTGVSWIIEHYLALLRTIAFDSAPDIETLLKQIPDGQIPAFRALPKHDSRSPNGNFVSPQTQTEEVLARLAAEVLGLKSVSADANFFSLGGHSLLVTQLLSRVRDTFHIEMPLRQIFESPTVAGLAQRVDTICWAARGAQGAETGAQGDYEEGEI
jgi:acyl carrier protein